MTLYIGTPTAAATSGDLANVRSSIGLGSVDNTADALKPASTAQAAINATVATNTASITANTTAIGTNTSAISANTAAIATKRDKAAAVTVTASRNLTAGGGGVPSDIGNVLGNASGSYALTLVTGLGAALDSICLHPTGTGTLTLAVATGVTLADTTGASLTVSAGGYLLIQCDGVNAWSRAV